MPVEIITKEDLQQFRLQLLQDLKSLLEFKEQPCYVYVSNQSDQDVYFDDLKVTMEQGRILEENHYYSFGLKIAAISSKKYSDSYDGDVKNLCQMQGAFAELDEDIGWNDFAVHRTSQSSNLWLEDLKRVSEYL